MVLQFLKHFSYSSDNQYLLYQKISFCCQLNFLWFFWQKDDLLWVASVIANLIWNFSNTTILFFYLHSFTFSIYLAVHVWFLKIFSSVFFFFFNEKLFGGFSKWPILVTVNLHLLLSKPKLGNSQKLFSLTVPPFNTLMPGGNKSSYIININSSF